MHRGVAMLQPLLRIREAAAVLSISPSTLRLAEQSGRIPKPQRTDTGQRVYSLDDLEKLRATLVPAARD
jgi:DNA-binding transcriptional MerR regulator